MYVCKCYVSLSFVLLLGISIGCMSGDCSFYVSRVNL